MRDVAGRMLLIRCFNTFRHHHNRIGFSFVRPIQDGLIHPIHVIAQLRQQDDIGTARHSGIEGDPSGVVTHHLDHHHPLMRTGRRMQSVNRFGSDIDRRIESEGNVRTPHIVVDRLGHTDHIQANIGQHPGCLLRAIATDADQAI